MEVHAALEACGYTYRNFAIAQHQELADQLRDLGVQVGEAVIPSIRSVKQVG